MMAKNPKKQQDDQFIDLPEDRIDQIRNKDAEEKVEKKPRQKSSAPRKTKQEHEATQSEMNDAKAGSEKVLEKPGLSKEDLLDDIRLELAGEEEVAEKKGLFGRFKDRFKKTSKENVEEYELPEQPEGNIEVRQELGELKIESKPKKKKRSSTKQEEKAIQEFFSDLEALADVEIAESDPLVRESEDSQSEEEKTKVEKIPKLPARSVDKEEIDIEKVREIALQEYDDTHVESVVERKVPLKEEVRKTIRESRPLERILMFVVFVLAAGALLVSGVFIIVKSIPISTPTPTAIVSLDDLVYPTHLDLPGGWGFDLGQGNVSEDGGWSPNGAEWLMGTEVSRWVALPWSLQLEAVLRTLKSGDQIELTMSNLDHLEFNVYSIEELTMEEIQAKDPKTPGLLIILFEEEDNSDTHWVVTALP